MERKLRELRNKLDVMEEKQEVDIILQAFYEVYNSLGYGFLERVYHSNDRKKK